VWKIWLWAKEGFTLFGFNKQTWLHGNGCGKQFGKVRGCVEYIWRGGKWEVGYYWLLSEDLGGSYWFCNDLFLLCSMSGSKCKVWDLSHTLKCGVYEALGSSNVIASFCGSPEVFINWYRSFPLCLFVANKKCRWWGLHYSVCLWLVKRVVLSQLVWVRTAWAVGWGEKWMDWINFLFNIMEWIKTIH